MHLLHLLRFFYLSNNWVGIDILSFPQLGFGLPGLPLLLLGFSNHVFECLSVVLFAFTCLLFYLITFLALFFDASTSESLSVSSVLWEHWAVIEIAQLWQAGCHCLAVVLDLLYHAVVCKVEDSELSHLFENFR